MPGALKTLSRAEILATPTFLNYLFRVALSGASTRTVAPNYRYWRQSGDIWASEYDRRKTRHPYYTFRK